MRTKTPHRHTRLFAEPEKPTDVYTAHVDGASRGNPGPASYAVIVYAPDRREHYRLGKHIGRSTNNVAQSYGLLAALDYAESHGIRKLRIRSDSELLVRQMQGRYKVKSADLRPLHERAAKIARGLAYFSIEHVRRELNAEADALANEALDGPRSAGASPANPQPRRQDGGAIKRVRARYSAGVLHPREPLDLAEGDEVEITIHRK